MFAGRLRGWLERMMLYVCEHFVLPYFPDFRHRLKTFRGGDTSKARSQRFHNMVLSFSTPLISCAWA